jgi:transposase, IS5 family
MLHFGLSDDRLKAESPMWRDRYDPRDLFALVPAWSVAMDPILTQLDQRLEDEARFQRVTADLRRRTPHTTTRGRPSTPVEVILRMLVVKRLSRWSDEETEQFVADSLVLRQFCRLYVQPVPDDTTLLRWANMSAPETLAALNDHVVALARALQVTRGRKLRVDTMVVETNIHHPTDSRLVGDGVHVWSRWLRRAKRVLAGAAQLSGALFRSRTRSVRQLARQIHRLARRKAEEAAEQLQAAYARLLAVAHQSARQAEHVPTLRHRRRRRLVRRIAAHLGHDLPLVRQAIRQAHRRVREGAMVPAGETLVSLFAPHTPVIHRHQPGQPVEFGRTVWLAEVEGGLLSQYRIVPEPGPDHASLLPSLDAHVTQFGNPPWLVAGDRGVYTAVTERLAEQVGVRRVVIPSAGKPSRPRLQHERTPWFRRGFRFRAGIEGRISVLRRRFGLDRCLARGEAGLRRWVGWSSLTANLRQLAPALASRQPA